MARSVHDVDLHAVINGGAVLGQNGDAALPLDVAGVHHALGHLLIFPERAALLEHLVHEGGLAVVDVGDDGNVAQICTFHLRTPSFLPNGRVRGRGLIYYFYNAQ